MSQSIIPEFVVLVDEDNIEVSLTSNPSTTIHINKDYTEIVKSETASRRQKQNLIISERKWMKQNGSSRLCNNRKTHFWKLCGS